jgi:hypothetical protein
MRVRVSVGIAMRFPGACDAVAALCWLDFDSELQIQISGLTGTTVLLRRLTQA